MMGDILPWRGTVCPSVDCPGGYCALVQNVWGDIPHGGTIYPPTPTFGKVVVCFVGPISKKKLADFYRTVLYGNFNYAVILLKL